MNRELNNRIRKLLALAESANEHEAKAAAAKARELLIRHNIAQSEVGAEAEGLESKLIFRGAQVRPEHKFAVSILNRFFFVKGVKALGNPRPFCSQVFLVGTPTNIAVGEYVYHFLLREFRFLWRNHRKMTRCKPNRREPFQTGLYHGLVSQLKAREQNLRQEAGLVAVPDAGLDGFFSALFPGARSPKKGKNPRESKDLRAGFGQGRNLRIRGAVEGAGPDGETRVIEAP